MCDGRIEKGYTLSAATVRRNLVEEHHNGTFSQLCLWNTQSRYHAVFPFCVSDLSGFGMIFTAPSVKHVMFVPRSISMQAQWSITCYKGIPQQKILSPYANRCQILSECPIMPCIQDREISRFRQCLAEQSPNLPLASNVTSIQWWGEYGRSRNSSPATALPRDQLGSAEIPFCVLTIFASKHWFGLSHLDSCDVHGNRKFENIRCLSPSSPQFHSCSQVFCKNNLMLGYLILSDFRIQRKIIVLCALLCGKSYAMYIGRPRSASENESHATRRLKCSNRRGK